MEEIGQLLSHTESGRLLDSLLEVMNITTTVVRNRMYDYGFGW